MEIKRLTLVDYLSKSTFTLCLLMVVSKLVDVRKQNGF